jgi:hypothetical protein
MRAPRNVWLAMQTRGPASPRPEKLSRLGEAGPHARLCREGQENQSRSKAGAAAAFMRGKRPTAAVALIEIE